MSSLETPTGTDSYLLMCSSHSMLTLRICTDTEHGIKYTKRVTAEHWKQSARNKVSGEWRWRVRAENKYVTNTARLIILRKHKMALGDHQFFS